MQRFRGSPKSGRLTKSGTAHWDIPERSEFLRSQSLAGSTLLPTDFHDRRNLRSEPKKCVVCSTSGADVRRDQVFWQFYRAGCSKILFPRPAPASLRGRGDVTPT